MGFNLAGHQMISTYRSSVLSGTWLVGPETFQKFVSLLDLINTVYYLALLNM